MGEFIENLRMTDEAKAVCLDRDRELQAVKVPRRKVKRIYVTSIPLGDKFITAKKLGVNPLVLYQLIHTAHALSPGGEWVKVPRNFLEGAGLPKSREYEAAGSLETAGLIVRRSKAGCKNMYKLNSN